MKINAVKKMGEKALGAVVGGRAHPEGGVSSKS